MDETIEEALVYILSASFLIILSSYITWYFNNRKDKIGKRLKIDKIAEDVNAIKHDFEHVKNCTRLTSKSQLQQYTKYYTAQNGIPLTAKATLIQLGEELHSMGENGEVSACIEELKKLEIDEDIK